MAPNTSDRPQPSSPSAATLSYGSDAVAAQLGKLGIRYLALVPGSSFRGLHDSLVNFGGNAGPAPVVCLHEERAVALAHGYAKVAGTPMAAAVHANVGLMHAAPALRDAAVQVRAGKPVILDVQVLPEGYSSAMSEKSR